MSKSIAKPIQYRTKTEDFLRVRDRLANLSRCFFLQELKCVGDEGCQQAYRVLLVLVPDYPREIQWLAN